MAFQQRTLGFYRAHRTWREYTRIQNRVLEEVSKAPDYVAFEDEMRCCLARLCAALSSPSRRKWRAAIRLYLSTHGYPAAVISRVTAPLRPART